MSTYFVYDVFTDAPFGGNQLAVFPDAHDIPEHQLQSVAAEFNFSEVTFVYPPKDSAHTARVRIFTPTQEVPFAGHPIIGTACALHDLGMGDTLVLELGVGPIGCQIRDGRASFETAAPLERLAKPDPKLIADALTLPVDAVDISAHAPEQVSLGLPFTIVGLTSRDHLANIRTDVAQFRIGAARYPTPLDFAIFAYWRDGGSVHARMFAPLDNIPEDPATGSACATLGALLCAVHGHDQNLTIHQGVDMGRPSVISVAANAKAVTVSGQAVKTMEGRLVI